MTINSEWVSILKTSHPTAFKESLHTVPVTWFVDGQIKLMKAAWIKTWEVFFQMQFIKTIDRAFDNGAQIVVMGFDDYTHVPECKGMTQRKRNKKAQDFAYDSSNGLPEAPPEDWNAAMRNRIFKVAVIQFIVKNIKLKYKNFDKTVIVDWVGVPVVLGTGGVEKIIELELLPTERAALDKSIAAVKELVATMNRLTASA